MNLDKFFSCVVIVWIVAGLISLSVTAAIIYAAIHFIAKYW